MIEKNKEKSCFIYTPGGCISLLTACHQPLDKTLAEENQGISNVDTLIITHYDQDHVGGADTLVEAMEIGRVLLPAYEGDSTEYVDFMNALE